MPGVVGIFSPEVVSENKQIITVMCNAIQHGSHQEITSYHYNNLDLGRVDLGIFRDNVEPKEHNNIVGYVWGECLNSQEERRTLVRNEIFDEGNICDADFLIASYLRDKPNFVQKLRGSFVVFVFDRQQRRLTIANDRLGLRPLYYCHWGNNLIFSSEVKGILKHPAAQQTVNIAGLADFLCFGFVTGTKTYFNDIKMLPPGGILTFEHGKGKCHVAKYWSLAFPESELSRPEGDYIERLSTAIQDSVKENAKGNFKFGLPLSGGMDSRTIAACLPIENDPPLVYTWGTPDSEEVQVARQIAEKLGFEQHNRHRTPQHFVENFERAVVMTDGMLPGNLPLANLLFEEVFMKHVDICFDGLQSISIMLPLRRKFPKSGQSVLQGKLFNIPEDILKNVLADKYGELFKEAAMESLKRIEEQTKGLNQIDQLQYFDITEAQPRCDSFAHNVKRNFVEIRTPLIDYRVVDVCKEIPSHLRRNRYIYYKALSQLSPELAAIKNMGTGLPATYPYWCQQLGRLKKGLSERIQKKLSRVSGINYTPHQLSDWGIDYDSWLDDSTLIREFVTEVMSDQNLKNCEHLNHRGVRKIVDARLAGKKEYTGIVYRLLTYVIWSKLFR